MEVRAECIGTLTKGVKPGRSIYREIETLQKWTALSCIAIFALKSRGREIPVLAGGPVQCLATLHTISRLAYA